MGSDFGGGSSGALWTVETKIGWRALGGQVGRPVTSRIVLGWKQVDGLLRWARAEAS